MSYTPRYFTNHDRAAEAAAQFDARHPIGTRVQVERGAGSGVFTDLVVVGLAQVRIPRVVVPLDDKEGRPIEHAVFIPFERIQPMEAQA